MSFRDQLVDIAETEWQRFGYSRRGLSGEGQHIVGIESAAPWVAYINDYWRAVNEPTWNGLTKQPWSAAFISWCMQKAGAGQRFPSSKAHASYCSAIVRKPQVYTQLRLLDPASVAPRAGDLVWAARSGKDCVTPPGNHLEALQRVRDRKHFCSHVDIVVEVGERWIDVIGGNVSDSVTRVRLATDANGLLTDPRSNWLGIIEVEL